MSMAPKQDRRTCPVCGDPVEGGCHACRGPRESTKAPVVTYGEHEIVTLPGDDPIEAARLLPGAGKWHREYQPGRDEP